jgi:serine/threonine-protein kinase
MAMTPERYERLCRLFDQAQGLAPGERAAFVEQACAGDSSLHAELERLLTHDRQAGAEPLWGAPCPVNARPLLAADQPATVPGPPPAGAPPEPVTLALPAGGGPEVGSDVQTVLRRRLR